VSRPWYKANPDLYAKVEKEVQDAYPDLRFMERKMDAFVSGYYPLFEGERVYDQYLIQLELAKESATALPIVREIGGRIPWIADRHIDEDGKACVVLPDAFSYEHPEGMTLLDYLNGPVRGFFACQSLIELGDPDPWPSGEWAHGVDGIMSFYRDLLGTDDPDVIAGFLNAVGRNNIKGHWLCPCGSGDKVRKCHRPLINELRSRIPRHVAARSEEKLMEAIRQARLLRLAQGESDTSNIL